MTMSTHNTPIKSDASSAKQLVHLVSQLIEVVGDTQVLTTLAQQYAYLQGAGESNPSKALAVVIPHDLVQLWRVINLCAQVDVIIIAQAANTGLTGGSTPYGSYDREVVVISMQQLHGVHLLNDASELIALPAASLQQLESILEPLGREPHSVLGSSCVGASVIGGICNNSGGMLVQRGPAYTEMALFARKNKLGQFELINHLGIELGSDSEEMLENLQAGKFSSVNNETQQTESPRLSCNAHYQTKVRDCDASTPARFNNDPSGLYEASGSAGRVIVFAVRVATFVKPYKEQTFYISSNDTQTLTTLRQRWLKSDLKLPVLAEYMHGDYNQITLRYGTDTCLSMRKLSASKIADLYRLRAKISYYLGKWHLPKTLPDRVLQMASLFMPASLPHSLQQQALSYRYHLIIKVADDERSHNIASAARFLKQHISEYDGTVHTCSDKEAQALLVFRSAATAAMFRYYDLNKSNFGEMLSTDIALPRNATDWDEQLPEHLKKQVSKTFYLGHFFCHVLHQDYLLKPAVSLKAFKDELLAFYTQRNIEYPAEHNVGHIYKANAELHHFYKKLDPTNSLNPGIGQTSKLRNWQSMPIMEDDNEKLYR